MSSEMMTWEESLIKQLDTALAEADTLRAQMNLLKEDADRSANVVKMHLNEAIAESDKLRAVINGFYDAIAHGDDAHKKWLKYKIESYLKGAAG